MRPMWLSFLVTPAPSYNATKIYQRRWQVLPSPDGQLLPWQPPNSMKCFGGSFSEQCVGSKVFCDHAPNVNECLEQRRRPVFQPGSMSSCRSEHWYSEACLGTVEWCRRYEAVRAWRDEADEGDKHKSMNRCMAWRVDMANSKKAWQRGTGCFYKTEACLGTDAWCVWHQTEYPSQETCLDAHEPRPRGLLWQFPDGRAPADSELGNGTEGVCLAIHSEDRRVRCLEARGPVPYEMPLGPGCRVTGKARTMDERCVGSAKWCSMMQRQYKTHKACLEFRAPRPDEKLAWRSKSKSQCGEFESEACVGTERWCFMADEAQQGECFAGRETAPLLPERLEGRLEERPDERPDERLEERLEGRLEERPDERPDEKPDERPDERPDKRPDKRPYERVEASQCADEACLGTVAWCMDRWKQTGYGSQAHCFAVRGVEPAAFMASVYTKVVERTQQVLVEASLARANATIVWEALTRATEDPEVWVQKGIEAGQELFAEMKKGGYLLNGIKRGVDAGGDLFAAMKRGEYLVTGLDGVD
ncbi:hypothetical protein CDD82_86 [Ophiocordyceps australis]|uniref:Uncharacterized protein n=1 Tax=Ophiocordyceps australis TaxID=1399860 RepID=A0A2C5YNA6_9HYPO|nr:hypothetical protein CDD82_86 [Ophiocordyceps australis]